VRFHAKSYPSRFDARPPGLFQQAREQQAEGCVDAIPLRRAAPAGRGRHGLALSAAFDTDQLPR
jgi:hypothetical protein